LRAPDGSANSVDGQLLRVWFRRKYIDAAWVPGGNRSGTVMGQNQNQNAQMRVQPTGTRAQIPPKNVNAAPAPSADLLGGWDSAPAAAPAPVPVQVPVANQHIDAAWDAFGQSRSSAPAFQADFGSQNGGGNQQTAFQADFAQTSPQSKPMQHQPQPSPAQGQAAVGFHSNFPQQSPDPPQQQQVQASFNPNYPQPSTPTRQSHQDSGFNANFPEQPIPPQHTHVQQQTNQANFQQIQQQPQAQMQMQNGYPQQNVIQQAKFQQQMPPSQQGFNPHFQQQPPQQNMPQVQQQNGFNANFQQQQQLPQQPPMPAHSQQQNAFNANFQQQQQTPQQPPMPAPSQQQNGFNANFKQQQQPPMPSPVAPQKPQQNGFSANFQQQQQPTSIPSPDHPRRSQQVSVPASQQQHTFNAHVQQQQSQQPSMPAPAPAPQQQNAFNANFQQQQAQPTIPPPVPPQQAHQMPAPAPAPAPQQHDASNSNFQQCPPMPSAAPVPPQPAEQNAFSANFQQQESPAPSGEGQTEMETNGQNGAAALNDSSSMFGSSSGADPFDAFNSLSVDNPNPQPSELPRPVAVQLPEASKQATVITTSTEENVQRYEVGKVLEYTDSQQNVTTCEIIRSHLDDGLVPFYDIRMSDGREKQTDNAHLSLPSTAASNTEMSISIDVPKEETLKNIAAMLGNLNQDQLSLVEIYVKNL